MVIYSFYLCTCIAHTCSHINANDLYWYVIDILQYMISANSIIVYYSIYYNIFLKYVLHYIFNLLEQTFDKNILKCPYFKIYFSYIGVKFTVLDTFIFSLIFLIFGRYIWFICLSTLPGGVNKLRISWRRHRIYDDK